jgi:hypothetical protein
VYVVDGLFAFIIFSMDITIIELCKELKSVHDGFMDIAWQIAREKRTISRRETKRSDRKKLMNSHAVCRVHKYDDPLRSTYETFLEDLNALATERVFQDGTTKIVVHGGKVPRSMWPFDENDCMFEKLSDVASMFEIECVRDDPNSANVYLIMK